MKEQVLIGLSGGVDSALTAALLQRDGFDVTGLYCIMHDADASGQKAEPRIILTLCHTSELAGNMVSVPIRH